MLVGLAPGERWEEGSVQAALFGFSVAIFFLCLFINLPTINICVRVQISSFIRTAVIWNEGTMLL